MGFSRLTTGAEAFRKGEWLTRSAAVILVFLGCACVTVLAQDGLGSQDPEGSQSAKPQCTSNNSGSSCTCPVLAKPQAAQAAEELTATLSEESPNMDLTCVGANNSGAPDTMSQGNVCPGGDGVNACLTTAAASASMSKVNNSGTTVTLDSLLALDATSVKWDEDSTVKDQKKYSLAVPKASFPLLDKQFFVGCKDNTPNTPVCKVSVAVKARKSATVGQAVACAYGSASNVKRQSVTLTPSNNTLTISCGKEGKIVPTADLTQFCAYGEDPGSCEPQAFTGLLPGFDQSWWDTKEATSAILTIPAEKFPADERKFTIGCKYTAADSSGKTHEARSKPASPETSVCSVDVTITKQPSTTTTTSSTSSASSSVFVAGTSVNVMVALVSLGALQAVSSLA